MARTPPVLSVVSLSSHRYGKDPARYPFQAIQYLLTHRSLWTITFKIVCISSILSIITLTILLITALRPQALLINEALPWWAWLLSLFLVFLEAALLTAILMLYSQSRAQTRIFVETMRLEGRWDDNSMVEQSPLKDLNFTKKAMVVRLLTLPIQIIPLIGGPIYSAMHATFTGWDYMDRYFDAIQLSSRKQRIEVFDLDISDRLADEMLCGQDCSADWLALCSPKTYDSNNDYARFGFICSYLESIPIVGWTVFPLTNAVAAALFACDIEKSGGLVCLRSYVNST